MHSNREENTVTQDRERERKALSVAPEMLQLLVDNLKEYAIIMLDPRGHVATWSSAAARLKGYRADEIIGKHFYP